jgi:hypothetical protein
MSHRLTHIGGQNQEAALSSKDRGPDVLQDRMVEVLIVEPRRRERTSETDSPNPALKLTFEEARAVIEPFLMGGFFALVRKIDGSGDIVRSAGEVSIDAKSIIVFPPIP